MSETVLDRIKAYKLEEVAADKVSKPYSAVEEEANAAGPTRGFAKSGTSRWRWRRLSRTSTRAV